MAPGDAPGTGSAAGGYRQHRATPPAGSRGLQLPGVVVRVHRAPLGVGAPPAASTRLGVSAALYPFPGVGAPGGPTLLWEPRWGGWSVK